MNGNLDTKTVEGFGAEWSRFDQSELSDGERERIFKMYFKIFPWGSLPKNAAGFDLGCGSGRWAFLAAQKVGSLHCIDASADALAVAKNSLKRLTNCVFHCASVDQIPLADGSMDFGYSLGVLHHVPNTAAGIKSCTAKLKPGAPFLVYLYYAFDNRPAWFYWLWKTSDLFRQIICRLPNRLKFAVCSLFAVFVYWPLARTALVMEKLGLSVRLIPLNTYKNYSFYTMRTDALDRFGTRLEQRFTRKQILEMMTASGLERISFSDESPFWCAVGYKKN